MEMTIVKVLDDTPRGLTTGFRLTLTCQVEGTPPFQLELPIRLTKEILNLGIPMSNLAIAYLKAEGLDSWPYFLVDPRRLNVASLSKDVPPFPLKLVLGGHEAVARRALDGITQRKA